ncbi:MAG: hypothetical protein LBJ72_14200, partial [Dysgonamonadaceae bacterium]|nr:hypothetical protein [Dysgonamonadaceae bacterium]
PDPGFLFEEIKQERIAYIEQICLKRPANKRFMKGWLNRLADFRWAPTILLFLSFAACRSAPMQKTVDVKTQQVVQSDSGNLSVENSAINVLLRQNTLSEEDILENREARWVRYDTSLPESPESKRSPVLEEIFLSQSAQAQKKNLNQTKVEMQSVDSVMTSGHIRVHSEKEDLTLLKDELAKDPYRWRYIFGIIALVLIGYLLYKIK